MEMKVRTCHELAKIVRPTNFFGKTGLKTSLFKFFLRISIEFRIENKQLHLLEMYIGMYMYFSGYCLRVHE